MDYLSEGTKKERRNLLATGFAGIIIAKLKLYPIEIDLLGLKFQSPDLPFVLIGGLCSVIAYFLVKFYLSLLYEEASAATESLSRQIQEGKTALDIARAEELLKEEQEALLQQTEVARRQYENSSSQIDALRQKQEEEKAILRSRLSCADENIAALEKAVDTQDLERVRELVEIPHQLLEKGESQPELSEVMVLNAKYSEEKGRIALLEHMAQVEQRMDTELRSEESRVNGLHSAMARDIEQKTIAVNQKRKNISDWEHARLLTRKVSPFHRFLDIYLPLVLGAIAIGSLLYLFFHFPPLPKPASLPEL